MAHNSSFTKVWAEETDGLSIEELQTILGSNSGDLGTLCKHPNINKWAKHKPTRFSAIVPNPISNPKQWQGDNGLCGFAGSLSDFIFENFRTGIASNSFLDLLMSGQLEWEYEAPAGIVNNSPYRQLDFDGYISNAISPVGTMPATVRGFHQVSPNPDTLTITFPELPADNLKMTDIGTGQGIGGEDFKVGEFYFGVVVYSADYRKFACGTSTAKIKNFENNSATIQIQGMRNVLETNTKRNLVYLVPYFSSVEFHNYTHSTTDDAPEGIFLSAFTSEGSQSAFIIEDAPQTIIMEWNEYIFDAGEAQYVNGAYFDIHISETDDDVVLPRIGIAEYDATKSTNHSYDTDNDIIAYEDIDAFFVHPTTDYEQNIQHLIGDLYGLIESGKSYVFVFWGDNFIQEASPIIQFQ